MIRDEKNISVSVVIPFRDQVGLLKKCLRSILEKTAIDSGFEIILINNQSEKKETEIFLEKIKNRENIFVLEYDAQFNFSAMNNLASKKAKGKYLLFLNNDTEVISENWIDAMLCQFEDPSIGVVGAKLLYPDGTIQHAGIGIKNGDVSHSFGKLMDSDDPEDLFNKMRESDAVTAACMMTRKELFEELGGFDEINLPIAYNDVDYCFKVREKGLKVIYTPEAKLYHYESATRGSDIFLKPKRYKKFLQERAFLRARWCPRYFE